MIEANIPIPEILKGTLEFGNAEQIKALVKHEAKIAAAEEQERKLKSGELKRWQVEVLYRATDYIDIVASSKEEAERIAQQNADIDGPINWDCEIGDIEEVHGQ